MPISNSDIQFRLSGGSSNTDPNASLGGAMSSTAMGASLFDNVGSSEATSGRTEFRCVYVRNNDSTRTLSAARAFLTTVSSGGRATHDIASGAASVGNTEAATGAETTSPIGVTFSAPTTYATGIPLGDIPAGGFKSIWIRRTVPPGAAAGSDGFSISVSGDSPP